MPRLKVIKFSVTPDQEEEIEATAQYLRSIGLAGVPTTQELAPYLRAITLRGCRAIAEDRQKRQG
jgi:hypothetical protein